MKGNDERHKLETRSVPQPHTQARTQTDTDAHGRSLTHTPTHTRTPANTTIQTDTGRHTHTMEEHTNIHCSLFSTHTTTTGTHTPTHRRTETHRHTITETHTQTHTQTPTHRRTQTHRHTVTETHQTQRHPHHRTQTWTLTQQETHTHPQPFTLTHTARTQDNERLSRRYRNERAPELLLTLSCSGVVHQLSGLDTALPLSTLKIMGGCRCTHPSIHFLCACTLNTRKLTHMLDSSQEHTGRQTQAQTFTHRYTDNSTNSKVQMLRGHPFWTQDNHNEKQKS